LAVEGYRVGPAKMPVSQSHATADQIKARAGKDSKKLEGVIESSENGSTMTAKPQVNKTDHKWLGDAAKADAAHWVKCFKRIPRHFMEYAAGLEERREFENSGGVHDGHFEDAGPHFEVRDR